MGRGFTDPAIRNRVLEALKTLTEALEQSAANHSPAAKDNLREAADGAMRAVARLKLGASGRLTNQSGADGFPFARGRPRW